jgi:lipopolysaccharide biosynthesis glycosyltransferase
MDIAFGFDEHYSGYVQVTIESVLQQHPDDRDITFWVMTTKEGRDLLREPLRRQTIGRAHVEMLDSGESFRGLPLPGRWKLPWISAAMYLRLLMPAAVSPWAERLLYLDVDVLCMSSLTELWETNLGGASLGAVVDTCTPTIGSRTGLPGAPDFIKPDGCVRRSPNGASTTCQACGACSGFQTRTHSTSRPTDAGSSWTTSGTTLSTSTPIPSLTASTPESCTSRGSGSPGRKTIPILRCGPGTFR